jgi:hypothetical protein
MLAEREPDGLGDPDAVCTAEEDAEPLLLVTGVTELLALPEADGEAAGLALTLGLLESVSVALAEALPTREGESDGDGDTETAGVVPDTVTLAHLKVPAVPVAPSPTIAPQKFALSLAAAGIALSPDCGDSVIASEKTALEEKLDVALPADEKTILRKSGPVALAWVPVTSTTMPLQPAVEVQNT